ncbi:unnamed protein product, partial [Allacma fusca]
GSSTPKLLYLFPERSLYFQGRKDEISEIHQAVQVCQTQTHSFLRTIVIQGFGGIGKSETVRAYIYQFRTTYDYIVWFDAQTEISLNFSFKRLAAVLELPFKSKANIPNIYQKLANTYNCGIFIFDNAERLETENNGIGIKEYMHTDYLDKKPIIIVTSRNGTNAWDAIKTKIKIISLDCLPYEDTCLCLKKYLKIDKKTLPPSLEESICSIAKSLEGYPLALSLVSTTMGKLADDISLEEIQSQVGGYMELLKIVPIKEIYDESDYQERFNLIFEATTKKLQSDKNGSTAIDLLAIMSYLDPDGITRKLLYAIFSCKFYDSEERFEINGRDFTHAMKLLQGSFMVKIDKECLNVHRLIQKSARTLANKKPVMTILKFFDQNADNHCWRGHMETVYNALIDGTSVENKTYFLCMLAWKIKFEDYSQFNDSKLEILKKYTPNRTNDEDLILQLVELYQNTPKIRTVVNSKSYSELIAGILGLTTEFLKYEWVMECCIRVVNQILHKFPEERKSLQVMVGRKQLSKTRALSDIIVCNYTNLCRTTQIVSGTCIVRFLYGPWSTRRLKDDSEFFMKFVCCCNSRSRSWFWGDVSSLSIKNDGRNLLMDLMSTCGVEIFTQSLRAGNQREESISGYFLDCLTILIRNEEYLRKLAETKEFLIELSEAWKWLNVKTDSLFPHVASIWVGLFVQDLNIYTSFKEPFEQELEKTFKLVKPCACSYVRFVKRGELLKNTLVFTEILKASGHATNLADRLCSWVVYDCDR